MGKSKSSTFINLNSLFSGRKAVELDVFDRQNRVSATVISALMMTINLFWIICWLFGANISSFNHPYGMMGILLSTVTSLIPLILLLRFKELNGKALNIILLVLHFSINISVVLLAIGRCAGITQAGTTLSSYNGITLSTYYVIICAFMPLYSRRDSLICMTFMFLSGFVPMFVLRDTSGYILVGNIIIRLCAITAYVVLRQITYTNASLQAELIETAYNDMLTGFLNRRALYEYIDTLDRQKPERLGIMLFDIDDFKSFNEEYSHERADMVLKRICDVVREILSAENAKLFSYNGDEFVAIMEGCTDEELLKTAIRVKDAVEQLHIERKVGSIRDCVTLTIGCTSVSCKDCIERDIINEAETQLQTGKKGAKNCVVFKGRIYVAEGEVSMEQQPTHYTERVVQAIGEAMKNREIKAYYQPLYETVSHRLVGAEALSRWEKSNGNIIRPSEFIPELEKSNAILALDWYMYEEACKMLSRQREMNVPQVRISVNFSRMHVLYERDIEHRLCEIADSYSLPHSLIEIEITESAYIRLPNIIDPLIKSIRAQGFLVAVDDFGSGASSLEFIKNVDVDTLKIDRSLISSECLDEKERVLLESVMFLAHRLQLNSVAEGVETMEQMGFLKTLGVNQIQGFIFSQPLPENEFIETCRRESGNIADAGLLRNPSQSSTLQMLIDTVFKEYPVVVMSNLSRDSYYTMSFESMENFSFASAGSLSKLLDEISNVMEESVAEDFKKRFDIKKQFQNYRNGTERFFYSADIRGKDGIFRRMETTNYFIKEEGNDDLLVVTLCSEFKED